jgi:osmotically-inducible protein OsmY
MRTLIVLVLTVFLPVTAAHAVTFIDAWTEARTKVAVLADPRVVGDDVPRIQVNADGATVRLQGVVASEEARQAAADAAQSVQGVTRVENELRVVPAETPTVLTSDAELQKMVAQSMAVFRRPGLGGRTVKAQVRDGVATLTGSVDDISDWALASERARQVSGVKAVDNRVWVKSLRLSAR